MYELPEVVFYLVLFIDYKQLYGCGYLKSLWRTVLLILAWMSSLTLLLLLAILATVGWHLV